MKVGIALADVIAGKDAAIAILGVVAERASGEVPVERRRINISLADSARAALVNVAQNVLVRTATRSVGETRTRISFPTNYSKRQIGRS